MPENLITSQAVFPGGETREVRGLETPLTIHRPVGAAKGRIVMVPGWSGPRSGPADLLVYLASELCRAGWLVGRLDLPGRGDASGNINEVDLDGMIAVAERCCVPSPLWGEGRERGTPPDAPTCLMGLCSGANVALGVAALTENLQPATRNLQPSVIALSALPFQPARTGTFERRRRWRNLKQYAAKAVSPESWRRLVKGEVNLERVGKNLTASEQPAAGARNLKDSTRDIESELLQWRGKALFVWGGGDEESPPARAHFEALHARGMGQPSGTFFETIPGANHNFYSKAWRAELLAAVVSFLEQ